MLLTCLGMLLAVYMLADPTSPNAGATSEAISSPGTTGVAAPAANPTATPTALPPPAGPTSAPTAGPNGGPTPYAPIPGQKQGIHLLLDDGRNHWPAAVWPEHVQAARRIVGENDEPRWPDGERPCSEGDLHQSVTPCSAASRSRIRAMTSSWSTPDAITLPESNASSATGASVSSAVE